MRAKRAIGLREWVILGLAAACVTVVESRRRVTYLIDASYGGVEGAASGGYTGVYSTITGALGNVAGITPVPAGSSASNPNFVYIAPGTYNTANDAHATGVSLSNNKSNIALIGLTGNPDDVVITSTLDSAYNTGSATIGTSGSASLLLSGRNVSALNLTFANSTNTPYIQNVTHQAVSPTGNYATGQSQTANQPAVALKVQGDQNAFQNCKFLGYQDTLYVDGGRAYFKNCYVSGDIDFIFSKGTGVFNNCTINLDGDHSGGTIVAASTDKRTSNGIVFLNSTVTGNSVRGNPVIDSQNAANVNGPVANNMWLARPWGWQQTGGDSSTLFINTKFSLAMRAAGWLNWNANELNAANGKNDGNPAKDSRLAEFNSTTDGTTPVDVSQRVTWSHQLTAAEAAAYTVANIFSPEGTGSGQYPWYGLGYPAGDANNPGTGSPNPGDPRHFSWPAYWGDRNSNNDTANATVSQIYPIPGNPAGYTNPQWALAGAWNADAQLAAVPEPAAVVLLGLGSAAMLLWRRRTARE